ncbi:hypothetical protein MsAg5_15660 [Methanosarcinaceae archaeon Ag5]|uniref:Fido domain-containing protein n=1 Tax=Methanolapillus africanus TaxID=3028297 RepID=A0AAE4SDK3_9EURY|nr:hypothetical protein [Methanosarcinaceae archaeon Ag5]
MDSKFYRVEKVQAGQESKPGEYRYYLIKDIQFKDQKSKVRKRVDFPDRIIFDAEFEKKIIAKKASMSLSYFHFDYLIPEDVLPLEYKKFLYETFFKNISADEAAAYHQFNEINYIHGTTSIEGNTLNKQEVSDLIEKSIQPAQKSLREIFEVQNYKKVRLFTRSHTKRIDSAFVKKLHLLVMENILDNPGQFRQIGNIGISGCDFQLTPPELVEEELEAAISKYYQNIDAGKYPFEQIIQFHYEFEMIHPFVDGNGRVGRELVNYLLKKEGYPDLILRNEDRADYIKALQFGNNSEYKEMIEIFSRLYQIRLSKIETEFDRLKTR